MYRGTTQQHSDYAGPVGEITVDTEKYTVVVQNGVTGGVPLAREDTVVSLTNRIAAEESARATANTALRLSITDEVSARKSADTALQNSITTEASARKAADTAFQKSITDEASARETADMAIQKSVTDEVSARKAADTALQKSITDEASARETADTAIQKSVTDEVSARKAADTTLQNNIDNEASARETADTAIQKSVTDIDSKTVHLDGTETVTGDKAFTGGVTVGGYEPECVVDKEDEFQYGHIRYSSGLQICWGWAGTFSGGNGSSKTFTFAKPFKVRPHVFCTSCNGAYKWETYNAETYSTTTTGTIKIWVVYGSADKEATVAFNWLAIGYWK